MPAKRVCSRPGCPNLSDRAGKCTTCTTAADRIARPSSTQRGYARNPQHRAFRAAVLARDPICVICHKAPSVIADHWPRSRRQLIAEGLDHNAPEVGRGLCRVCDGRQGVTRPDQGGGWNRK